MFHITNTVFQIPCMARRLGKKKLSCTQNIFLMPHHLVFVNMKYFFVLHQLFFDDINTFFCNINTFLSKPNYFLCNVKRFISTQNYFSCNTKFLFWASFRMLCHDDILLLSHSNKNIIKSQKIKKLSFLCDKKR